MKARRFLMMLLSLVALTAGAFNYDQSFTGNCGDQGDNVTFTWDPTTRTMTFSGTGRMADFDYLYQAWHTHQFDGAIKSIEYVVIGEGITYIGKHAFHYYDHLYGVVIAASVTEIGQDAFADTHALSFIRLKGNTLPKLEDYNVFYGAPKHRKFLVNHNFVVPKGLGWVLHYNPGSYEEDTDREVNYMVEIDGTCGDHLWYQIDNTKNKLSVMGWGAMNDYTDTNSNRAPWNTAGSGQSNPYTTLNIEGRETNIGEYAFINFNNITSVTIPNTVVRIGQHAFHACRNLASCTFPNQLQTIGNSAFIYNEKLEAITLPNSLTTIGANAFESCDALKTITLGNGTGSNSLTTIAADAFKSCTAVSDIYCYADPTNLTWATTDNQNFKMDKGTKCHVASGVLKTWKDIFSVENDPKAVNVTFEGDLGTTLTGEGTVNNPYLLWSASDLVMISNKFNDEDELDKVKGKHFLQCANLEFNKETENNYTPIAQFDGDYDGSGYLISGLNVKKTTDDDNAALFLTMAEGSKVYNVIIKNSSFQGSKAAAIVCELDKSATITNCHVLKDVTIRANKDYAGGLVAHMYDMYSTGVTPSIKYCTSHATLYADNSYAGGLVGYVGIGSLVNSICLSTADNIHSKAGSNSNAVCQKGGGSVDNCYYTASASTLNGANGKLVLADLDGNTDFLEMMMERDEFLQLNSGLTTNDINYNLALNGRTLFKEIEQGQSKTPWNTLCLPFSVSDFTGTPLERAIVKTFTGSNYENDHGEQTLTLTFSDNLTSIEAGKPYIVKWNPTYDDLYGTHNEVDVENPEFTNVTVSATTGSTIGSLLVDFVGTLSPVPVEANNKSLLYMGSNNKLRYSGNGTTIGSCRSYFLLSSSGTEVVGNARVLLNFGDDEVTAIENINRETISNNQYYDLQGRKLAGQPTQKGLYIVNGKKMIVK